MVERAIDLWGEPYRLNKQCITEALAITMSSNNGEIGDTILPKLMGLPSGDQSWPASWISFVDPIVKSGRPLEPRFWKRYGDDTFDIVWGEML